MGADSSTRPHAESAPLASRLDVPRQPPLFPNRRLLSIGRGVGRQALELLLPSTCRLCDQCLAPGGDFCPQCLAQLQSSESLMQFACGRCGRPGSGQHVRDQGGSATSSEERGETVGCPQCRRKKLAFDQCIALWTYDGLVRTAVVAAKYGSQIALADALGQRLSNKILSALAGEPALCDREVFADSARVPDVVTAVPSHLWRRIQRGHGGSRALAAAVTRCLRRRWPSVRMTSLLKTTRRIEKQAWLGEKERVSNVQGAFCINPPRLRRRKRPWLSGKHVLLIDDVMTTGATAGEISGVLKAAGASRVTVAVVARAYDG